MTQSALKPRRSAGRLTVAKVRTAGPGKHHDGGGTGLLLRVDPSGARFWIQRITIHGKRRELGLGSFPLIGLADAREAALQNKRLAYSGGNPLAERRKSRETVTFQQAVESYLSSKLDEFRNEKHKSQWRSTLDRYARPVLGELPVGAIQVSDVLRAIEPIWSSRTETASRLRGRIENVLSWATVAGHREGPNPARWRGNLSELLPKPSKVAVIINQPALTPEDAPRWWSALSNRDGMAVKALQFLALTATRSGEVRGAQWDEFDLGRAVWIIPASRMKMKREHRVPLTREALSILEELPRLDRSQFVFFAPRGGQLSDMALSAAMRRLNASAIKEGDPGFLDPQSNRPAVPHGLRSSFRQWAAECGFDRDMAEMALAHRVGDATERAYQRADMLERRRSMMIEWAAFLQGKRDAGANVVALHGPN